MKKRRVRMVVVRIARGARTVVHGCDQRSACLRLRGLSLELPGNVVKL